MYCLELALGIIIYSLLFDDAGIGSTGTDSLANTATNTTQVLQLLYCIIQHAISTVLFIAKFNDCTIHPISVHIIFYPIIIIIQRKIIFRRSFFLSSPCHYMRTWICILDAPGCYERTARVERKSTL